MDTLEWKETIILSLHYYPLGQILFMAFINSLHDQLLRLYFFFLIIPKVRKETANLALGLKAMFPSQGA